MLMPFDHERARMIECLLAMASHADTAVARAMRALVERDDGLSVQVQVDDEILDNYELEVDDLAIHLLAMAPLASQLRLITVGMKVSQNLERVGDQAVTIARRVVDLNTEPQLKPYVDLPRMAAISRGMLTDAIRGFADHDPVRARGVIPRDREVDDINRQLHRELSTFMIERPTTITRCLHLMVISKAIERIADHAKNIAHQVVYLYEGKDIRHAGAAGQRLENPGR